MLTQHIALVPEADGIDASELARVSAALQKQVTRDLSPAWGITATVDAFPYLEDVPVGYWPIIVSRGDVGGHAGVHIDRNGQPYALVRAMGGWSLAASRACLEMLINPFENRFVTAPSMRSDQAPVEYLVEVCAPCEDARHAYTVNGVAVSDFCLPAFFGGKTAQADRYSWNGSVSRPFELPKGGHVTWYDPVENNWWLRSHWGENPVDTSIGIVDRKLFSVRELAQACTPLRGLSQQNATYAAFEGLAVQARRASQVRAHRLRILLGEQLETDLDKAVDAIIIPPAVIDEPDIEIEEVDEFDFDAEPTLVTPETATIAPERVKRASRSSEAHSAKLRNSPPPLRTTPVPRVSTQAPARPSSLTPISFETTPEPTSATQRSRQLVAGGALALAAAAALGWGLRGSSHPENRPQISAASYGAPVIPAPAPVTAPATQQAPGIIPGSNAAPTPAAPAAPAPVAVALAAPVAPPVAAAPAAEPARPARIAPRRPAPRMAPPEPSPVAAIRSQPSADALEDLIDSRR